MSKDSESESLGCRISQNITVNNLENEPTLDCILRRDRRLINLSKQKYSDSSSSLVSNEEVKRHIINDVKPPRSTYIPIEVNDASIYETGINSGIHFENFNEIEVKVSGHNAPKQIESFETCISIPKLLENINKCKFKKPTPIQKNTIPIILSGKDLMAAAQTGSGKTVAYVLPIIQRLLMEPQQIVRDINHSEPQVIIMAPTRELVVQIKTVVMKLSRETTISSIVCYGGTLVSHQKDQILKGCHILVATPGRLNEFVQHGYITFNSVRIFVLDEVDRMLEYESKVDIDKILDHFSMPPVTNRQTIMVSATLPDDIQHLATFYLNKNYLFLAVGIVSSASKDITQIIFPVKKYNKRRLLINILGDEPKGTIVFVEKKWTADFLATYLCEKDIPSTSIHGDRSQDQREKALNDFIEGKMFVLVATAVASRGLDIKCVNHVINYDMPKEIEEYVQKIGRTGRLGNEGKATSFFDFTQDYALIEPIIKTFISAKQTIPTWLLQQRQEIIDKEENENHTAFGGTDIRKVSNSVDECEEW